MYDHYTLTSSLLCPASIFHAPEPLNLESRPRVLRLCGPLTTHIDPTRFLQYQLFSHIDTRINMALVGASLNVVGALFLTHAYVFSILFLSLDIRPRSTSRSSMRRLKPDRSIVPAPAVGHDTGSRLVITQSQLTDITSLAYTLPTNTLPPSQTFHSLWISHSNFYSPFSPSPLA
jgi:hypothetical protein